MAVRHRRTFDGRDPVAKVVIGDGRFLAQTELEAAVKKNGFKDFNDYDEVTTNITMVMTGIDPNTKVFTDPAIAIKEEIQEVTADKDLPAPEKKQMLDELNEALKSAPPIQYPNNIELVRKHYDKIDEALN